MTTEAVIKTITQGMRSSCKEEITFSLTIGKFYYEVIFFKEDFIKNSKGDYVVKQWKKPESAYSYIGKRPLTDSEISIFILNDTN